MHFLAADQLWLLVLLPLLVAAYFWLLARRKRFVLSYPAISAVREAIAASGSWHRHVPPMLLLLAMLLMMVAGARPALVTLLPADGRTVVLAMDVSGSMQATDILPSRIAAAQSAAKEFVAKLPASARVAVVAYAGTAHLVQAPTRRHSDVLAAIDSFQLQRATAIGDGLIVALGTIFPEEGISVAGFASRFTPEQVSHAVHGRGGEPGSYPHAAVVLLSDGQNTSGTDPLVVAKFAAQRGVRVYTVGFGTDEGATIHSFGWSARVQLDEPTLRRIAAITAGEYHRASGAAELEGVYGKLRDQLVLEKGEREISGFFANLALIFTMAAAGLSVLWFGRIA